MANEKIVPLSWEEFDGLIEDLVLKIHERGVRYDVILDLKMGGAIPGALLQRVLEHSHAPAAKLKRYEEGETESRTPPKILSFPSPESFRRMNVLIVDEVWDEGETAICAKHEVMRSEPGLVHIAVLHFKPENNKFPGKRPDFYAAEAQSDTYIEYPWETFEKRVKARMEEVEASRSTSP